MSKATQLFERNCAELEDYAHIWGREEQYYEMLGAYESRNDRALIKAANEMWWQLPDRPEIHSRGFDSLCQIAELMFE